MLQTKKKKERENNWKRKKKSVTKEEPRGDESAEANNWSWRANWRVLLCIFGHISGDKNGP